MDMISRQDAIDAIERTGLSEDEKDTAIRVVENLPSAQPEIIFCKDCKHRHNEEKCPFVHTRNGEMPFSITLDCALDDDYCSRAERKGEQE